MPEQPTRHRRIPAQLVLLLVLLLPLLCGAVAVDLVPESDEATEQARVIVVEPPTATPASASRKLSMALSQTPGFTWQTTTATEAAQQLSGHRVFAVVTIPESFDTTGSTVAGKHTGVTDSSARQVTVMPSGDIDDARYLRLQQAVSSTAARSGIDGLLVKVSKARTNLNVATLTASGLKAAAANADGTVNQVLASVNQLVGQSDPLVAQAQNLVAAIHQYSALIDDLSGKLSTFATGMGDVTLTLGDLQQGVGAMSNGLQSATATLQATAAIRAQLNSLVKPVSDALRASGFPEGQQVGSQLASLLVMAGSLDDPQTSARINGVQLGTELLNSELQNLSGLLGKPVDAQTRLTDVLNLAVQRLNGIGSFLAQGDTTINQVMGQLNGAKELVPGMETQIRDQLQQLKAVTTQLVTSLNTGVNELPDTSSATADRLSNSALSDTAHSSSAHHANLLPVVLAVLVGALAIALLQPGMKQQLTERGWGGAKASTASWCVSILLALGLAAAAAHFIGHQHVWTVFGCAALAALVMTVLSTALLRMFGLIGLGLVAASTAVVAVFDVGIDRGSAPALRLVPGSYIATGLQDASSSGATTALLLPVLVLFALGLCAVAVLRSSLVNSRLI